MSGSLIQLAAKGAQDAYITSSAGMSLFRTKYTRHKNFSQAAKLIKIITNKDSTVIIPSYGDLLDGLWFEGTDLVSKFTGCTFHLYIGGTKVDSQPFDFIADIWQNYMAETYTKSQEINNATSTSNTRFLPLHFYFCDHDMFLPLIALQYHQIELRIEFPDASQPVDVKLYGNYVYLDTDERTFFADNSHEFIITQVQRQTYDTSDNLDISFFNHPVKSLYFGHPTTTNLLINDKFTFDTADIYLNSTPLVENMSPLYYHSIQNYKHSKFGINQFDENQNCPFYTRYYAFNFCKNASSYTPTGTCNFSRLDDAKITLRNVQRGTLRTGEKITVYAVNYNILKVSNGMAGILFGN
tara:strand:- start:1046 stop:2107 length:1062 start_codon:yes stop_codon:yes gene_type:complete